MGVKFGTMKEGRVQGVCSDAVWEGRFVEKRTRGYVRCGWVSSFIHLQALTLTADK